MDQEHPEDMIDVTVSWERGNWEYFDRLITERYGIDRNDAITSALMWVASHEAARQQGFRFSKDHATREGPQPLGWPPNWIKVLVMEQQGAPYWEDVVLPDR